MTRILTVLVLIFGLSSVASANIKMDFKETDVNLVIEAYSKATGQKFIVDPGVRGKISILMPQPVSSEEAFNHLSTALAINGYAITKRADTFVVRTARNTQRDLIEVSNQLPTVNPERMVTWVVSLKNVSARQVNADLRILQSKDGEMTYSESTNQLLITDWTPNLSRISEILKQVDKPIDSATAKLIAQDRKTFSKREREVLPPPPGQTKAPFPPPNPAKERQ